MKALFALLLACMSVYAVSAVRRDLIRGVATGRGMSYDRKTQPKRYRVLISVNIAGTALFILSAIGMAFYALTSG